MEETSAKPEIFKFLGLREFIPLQMNVHWANEMSYDTLVGKRSANVWLIVEYIHK
jgi:hypothetical protein